MKKITTLSPAKLNLFLHITGKRDDGYHELQTVFRLLDWGDNMRFETSSDLVEDSKLLIRLHCDIQLTDNPNDNLIIKSALALHSFANTKQPLPIIDIYLDKKIPTGAGLGGGSSNAASTLMALNNLWELGLSNETLQNIGITLGADVPIFILAKDSIAEGIGEIFTPLHLTKQRYLLLTPSTHISTAKLFSHAKLQRNMENISTEHIIENSHHFSDKLVTPYHNVFQPVVCELSDEVSEALLYLKQFEPITHSNARMTGSGSCVFLPIPVDTDEGLLSIWLDHAPCSAILANSL